jgi:hypothetical protein
VAIEPVKSGEVLPPRKEEKSPNGRISKTPGTPCESPSGYGAKADPCIRSGQQQ